MKGKGIYILVFSLLLFKFSHADLPGNRIEQTSDGVIIYPDINFSGNARAIRLQVITDKIIRVTASPELKFPDIKSLILVYPGVSKKYTIIKKAGKLILKTPSVTATVLLSTGAISFADELGKPVVMERQYNGRSFNPSVFNGQNTYSISQTFETTPDDAYYGLGQHQGDQYNYKGQQVFLFQNNTEVAIPFLL
ncbi:MAG: hypothetical protein ABI863_00430, partial [Ginsengibacter sp.]